MTTRETFASDDEREGYELARLEALAADIAAIPPPPTVPSAGLAGDLAQIDSGDTAAAGATGRYADAGHQHPLSPLVNAGGGTGIDYTPSMTATTTNPTIGNGTLTGRYRLIGGDLMYVTISLVVGSTTTVGVGAYSFSFPAGFKSRDVTNFNQTLGGYLVDASAASARWPLAGDIRPNSTVVTRVYTSLAGNAILNHAAPVVLAVGDILVLAGLVVVEAV